MPCDTVTLGAYYRHDETHCVRRLEAASVPALDDHVFLTKDDMFAKQGFIGHSWRGTWQQFLDQWTALDKHGEPVPVQAELPITPGG